VKVHLFYFIGFRSHSDEDRFDGDDDDDLDAVPDDVSIDSWKHLSLRLVISHLFRDF